jgi:hypothetical protein
MRFRHLLIPFASFALILAGCVAPAEVAFADVCAADLDGKKITTTGSFASTSSVFCSDSGGDYRCSLDFVGDGSDQIMSADVLEGDGKNQLIPLPDSYTDADFQITTDDGSVIGLGTPARLTGKMLIAESVCLMEVDKIEVLP